MILLIGGEKGGAGKSTIACNLAVFLACQEKDVLLLDADPQKTSSTWAYRRSLITDQVLPKIHSAEKTGDIYDTVMDFSKRYKFIIIIIPRYICVMKHIIFELFHFIRMNNCWMHKSFNT